MESDRMIDGQAEIHFRARQDTIFLPPGFTADLGGGELAVGPCFIVGELEFMADPDVQSASFRQQVPEEGHSTPDQDVAGDGENG
jgi:hypothetical protein